ncbi:tryptamine hydroxycinnamoyltransferase 1 [Amborella trichopoda]|uniref:Uncharacterized protein n=1 Tax=Amborella trichopoda TaxID=13333 RepID=W1PGD5_AMBTC|nr:tryptamine hydroxycinnamoyltransferase 1 [Amborella trichopoda]ERN06671.1 hypothetical protein AMTR_s00058p00197140 [Amborella trichopoda]|eukprot:XP_006844996.1 tryptamine hydroxycinnamoyltransferase 1 [Amborella trichopoda]
MDVEILSSTSVKASAAVVEGLIPLTIFDRAAFDLHVPVIYAFRAPMPSNDALKHGLSEVLSHYPKLAGRLSTDPVSGLPCILLNNAGARVVEARVSAPLATYLPLHSSPALSILHPLIDETVEELLQVQITRFSCGGIILGTTGHHKAADGQSMSIFFLEWSRTVRAMSEGGDPPPLPALAPVHDRLMLAPRDPPCPMFGHREIEFQSVSKAPASEPPAQFENVVVHFPAEFVASLKAAGGGRYSTFECLLAHVWKKVTIARGINTKADTHVRIAVNGRARLWPHVPMGYFGNLVLWAHPKLKAEELLALNIADTARAIHENVGKIDDAYFRSFIDFGALAQEEELVATAPAEGTSLSPNLEVDSWLRFDFGDLNFGTGGPCAFLPPWLPIEGLLVFVPSYKEKGGVDMFMAISPDHLPKFQQICRSLD